MIKNYFKIAIRNLMRHKAFTAINIAGLATGLTCCLLMILHIQHELSFDRFHSKSDRIVRAIMEYSINGSAGMKGDYTSTKVLPSFKRNFPEVESGVRVSHEGRLVRVGDKVFNEKGFVFADSTFFDVFDFQVIEGNRKSLLESPNQIVLTATSAKKYFGGESPVGKTILIGSGQMPFKVTGVVEDCPSNSQIDFDFLASFSSLGTAQEETYFNANYTTYLLLKSPSSLATLQPKITPFMKKELINEKGVNVTYDLEPFTRIHLYSPYDAIVPNSNIVYVYIIGAIALLVLIIACFTYINLSTARSIERAREVGVRKVAGAGKYQLFRQFISESFVLCFLSLLISIGFAALLLPSFNQLSGSFLKISSLFNWPIIVTAFLLVLVISLLAGSYPALVLSNFQPVKVLKGSFKNTSSGTMLRQSLIVFQFVVSVFLIISTLVISGQLHFIQNKKLGYDRDHVIVMNIDSKILDKKEYVKTVLKSNPDILGVSVANSSPVNIIGGYSMEKGLVPGVNGEVGVNAGQIDEEFIKVNGLSIIAGTDLTRQDMLDASKEDQSKNYHHFILNETAVKNLGWTPQQAIGQKMMLGEQRPGEVKAVVKDFHFASLHTAIQPLVLFEDGWGSEMLVKVNGQHLSKTIDFLAAQWKGFAPHRPFEYRFVDDDYNRMYDSEMKTGKVFNVFAGIALLLACLGLFGLSAYTVKQRVKEIGVRKVIGASATSIVFLISNTFLKLVLIAFLIACPIAYWAMNKWLQGFVYRIDLSYWFFIVAGISAVVIALLTVSIQAIKAAVANPVKSLRTE